MKNVPIKCAGCGKTYEFPLDDLEQIDQHTFVAKCDCGATTQVEGDVQDVSRIGEIGTLLEQIPRIAQELRRGISKGVDTGIGEAVAEASKKLTAELLESDPNLKQALAKAVKHNLDAYLADFTQKDEESQKK